jgi:hypothetical protein
MQSLGNFDIVDDFIKTLKHICHEDGWKSAFPEMKTQTIDGYPNPGKKMPINE